MVILSLIDNFSWDKISHSLTKKSQTCKEGGAHLRISFWRLLMNFEKVEKSDFRKNEKNCWRYHHFTHVYQKPKSYEVQFLWYEVRRKFLAFWAIVCLFNCLHPNNAEKQNFEEMKKAFGDVIILNLCTKKNMIIWFMLTQIWSACTDMFCHFRPFFAFLLNYWPQPLKFGKKCKKTPGHIILLQMCTINQDHMMYGSWDMKFNRPNFFVILGKVLLF